MIGLHYWKSFLEFSARLIFRRFAHTSLAIDNLFLDAFFLSANHFGVDIQDPAFVFLEDQMKLGRTALPMRLSTKVKGTFAVYRS
jgi:hypothetical protein